jgi:hypothetical protein
MQGNKNEAAAGRVIDLDAQLAARMLEPALVQLGGHVYKVRTDLTPKQVTQVMAHFRAGEDVKGWSVLLGAADAKRLDKYLDDQPSQKVDWMVRALWRASVVLAGYAKDTPHELVLTPSAGEDDDGGESSAS